MKIAAVALAVLVSIAPSCSGPRSGGVAPPTWSDDLIEREVLLDRITVEGQSTVELTAPSLPLNDDRTPGDVTFRVRAILVQGGPSPVGTLVLSLDAPVRPDLGGASWREVRLTRPGRGGARTSLNVRPTTLGSTPLATGSMEPLGPWLPGELLYMDAVVTCLDGEELVMTIDPGSASSD